MNYFDDIEFISVNRVISRKDNPPGEGNLFWGIGFMLGEGCVKTIASDGKINVYQMPFLYLLSPNPDKSTSWGCVDGVQRDNRWILMQGPRAERIVTALRKHPQKNSNNHFQLNSYHELIQLHEEMRLLFLRNIPSKAYRLAVCLENFVGVIYDSFALSSQKSRVFQYVAKIAEMISSNPAEEYDFLSLTRKNHISIDHFRHCFLEYAGKPLYEFQLEKRLLLARDLLQNSSESIKEISERCGFPRQSEFARFIKQRTGITPSEFRKYSSMDS